MSDDPTPKEPNEEVKDPAAVLAKNKELLGINTQLKDQVAGMGNKFDELSKKFEALSQENQALKDARMKAEGDKDEYIKTLEGRLGEADEKVKKVSGYFLDTTVKTAFDSAALKHGCKPKYLDVLYNQVKTDNEAYGKVLGCVDKEKFTVDQQSLSGIIDGLKNKFDDSGLFENPDIKVDDETPANGGVIPTGPTQTEDDLLKSLEKHYQ